MTEHEELLQLELDGELPPEQERRLRDALAGDPALRARRDRLRGTVARLEALGRPEPDPDLAGDVMAALRRVPEPPRAAPVRSLRPRAPSPTLLRYAATFAAGAVLGGLVIAAAGGLGPQREDGLSATIPPRPGPAPPALAAGDGEPLDRAAFEAPGLRAEARAVRVGERLRVELAVEAGRGIGAELRLPVGLEPLAVDRSAGSPGTAVLGTGRVALGELEPGSYRVLLAGAGAEPLRLILIAGEQRVERELRVDSGVR